MCCHARETSQVARASRPLSWERPAPGRRRGQDARATAGETPALLEKRAVDGSAFSAWARASSLDESGSKLPHSKAAPPRNERGFTVLEVLIAMAVLVAGLLSLAYGVGLGLAVLQMSTMDTIAREKAREAMEDVFTARDTSTIAFSQICNIPTGTNSNNCLFVNGFTPMYAADSTGLVNTTAAATQGTVETYVTPGPDGILGTADDVTYNLTGFQRSISVTSFSSSDGYTVLAQVTVTIVYNPLPWLSRTVTMITVMSPYV